MAIKLSLMPVSFAHRQRDAIFSKVREYLIQYLKKNKIVAEIEITKPIDIFKPKVPVMGKAYFDAFDLLTKLKAAPHEGYRVGITTCDIREDLIEPGVFGFTLSGGLELTPPTSLISAFRPLKDAPDIATAAMILAKTIMHELGHLRGMIKHCKSSGCVMNVDKAYRITFAETGKVDITKFERTSVRFCAKCRAKIKI